jgi:predicted CXXCH cytochrome family protein
MKKHLSLLAFAAALAAPLPLLAEGCLNGACHREIGSFKFPHAPVAGGSCLACHPQLEKVHPLGKGKAFATGVPAETCSGCHPGLAKKAHVHRPVSSGNCLACHRPHGAAGRFLIDDADDDLTALCGGCHPTFKASYVHGPVAAGACTACHDPHQSDQKGLLKERGQQLCLNCHQDFARAMQAAARIHPPLKEKGCTACHDPHTSPFRYLLKEKMPQLCIGCHAAVGKKLAGAKTVHKPLLEKKGCGSCHSSHFANAKGLLAADEKSLCLGCHGTDTLGTPPLRNIRQEISKERKLHGPVARGKCSACHDPHAAQAPRLLVGEYPDDFYAPYGEGSYGLCLGCHNKNMLRFAQTTIYTNFRNGERNLHYLHVVDGRKGRSCRACHESHGANGDKLIGKEGVGFGQWRIRTRFTATPTGGSCAPGCHRRFGYDRKTPVKYEAQGAKGAADAGGSAGGSAAPRGGAAFAPDTAGTANFNPKTAAPPAAPIK